MRKAFTLIELLVVIAIIAILAAILFPVFAQARESAKNSALLAQMKQVGTGVIMYAGDNDDVFPLAYQHNAALTVEVMWQDAAQPYMKNWDIALNNKRTRPTGTAVQVAFKRTNHLGMPARASASANAAVSTQGFFAHTLGTFNLRYDGIAGIGFEGATSPYGIRRASSLSVSGIESPSVTCMVVEASNHDLWFAYATNGAPLASFTRWEPAVWNENPGNGYGYPVTATTRPEGPNLAGFIAATATTGTVPRGRSTYVATDSSARSVDVRQTFVTGRPSTVTTGVNVPPAFNPTGTL